MTRTIRFLAAVALVFGVSVSQTSAQTVDLRFNTTINTGAGTNGNDDQLEVVIEMDADLDFDLGSSNFRFTYNAAGLEPMSGPKGLNEALVSPTDFVFLDPFIFDPGNLKFYQPNTANTQTPSNRISANLVLGVANFGATISAAGGWTPIVTLYFNIIDPMETEMLQWVDLSDGNPSLVFDESNGFPAIPIDMQIDSDKPLDPTAAVELSTFTSRVSEDAVSLHWSTSSESENAGFGVELSEAGSGTWNEVGFVQGAGTSSDLRSYVYNIDDLAYGTYRVRLRQVNLDGSFEYSQELEVAVELEQAYSMGDVYPSPFANRGNFSLSVRDAQPVEVSVYNLLGQKVLTVFEGDFSPNETRDFAIDGATLANGVYLVRARGEAFAATTTVAVLK